MKQRNNRLTFFLFFASYATPVLLTQILAYMKYPLAWRGVSLALAAPLYIAVSLLIRNSNPRGTLTLVPTWALYSAGYALTAIGAMVAFEDEMLATYVCIECDRLCGFGFISTGTLARQIHSATRHALSYFPNKC